MTCFLNAVFAMIKLNSGIKNGNNFFRVGVFFFSKMELMNPYRQIPETISSKWAVTQGIFRKLCPGEFPGKFQWILEKVSGNSPGSLPEFTKFQISFKTKDFGKSFRKIP